MAKPLGLGYDPVNAGELAVGKQTFTLAWRGLCALAFMTCAASAQVMEIRADGSSVTYAGPVVSTAQGTVPLAPAAPAPARVRVGRTPALAALRLAAIRHDMSPSLVEAVAWQESRCNQNAVSPKGARGVMQLMPATARSLGVDARDLGGNVDGGAAYLAQMMQRFDGDIVALARRLQRRAGGGRALRRRAALSRDAGLCRRAILDRLRGVSVMRSNDEATSVRWLAMLRSPRPPRRRPAADPAGSSPLLAALDWVQGTLLGNLATTAAVIAVAIVGFMMLTGRIEWRRGLTVVIGCFIIFGAVAIVAGIRSPGRRACTDAMARLASDPVFAALTRPQMIGGVTYGYAVFNLIVTVEAFLITRSFWALRLGRRAARGRLSRLPARAALLRHLDHQAAPLSAGEELLLLAGEFVPPMTATFVTTGVGQGAGAARGQRSATACPISAISTRSTLRTRDGLLVQTLHLQGFPFETASDEELNYRKTIRETVLRGAASSRLAIYHHVVRRRVTPAFPQRAGQAVLPPPRRRLARRGWPSASSTSTTSS